ncbi:ribonuclease Z [Wenyingzhuangia sp. 2_MG-2023]|uniref:ribonuclease Z n=1 Tax=Wenyingzhuangia sp. 2_MG-2023 TaxID=3062639 RepID=UPI0026E1487F|nr:ribonuclease Z [Wenyingzhuangia sp. 2_MG-2023]MDO6737869.1 ribonuclease Z [Wenyingzhuangia sp. 2_MG-2023]
MGIQLTILGCHSASPRTNAYPTAQYLKINERHILIDCGEGTQVLLRQQKVPFAKIKHIFISHLHGDHFFGLVGLISTFGLLDRRTELHVYGPKGIKEVITLQLKLSKSWTAFPLLFHELNSNESTLIFEDKKISVTTIPLNHRVYTNGFLFEEKTAQRKLNMSAIGPEPEIEICDYHNLKNGKDFVKQDGTILKNEELTLPPQDPKSYAFCSDTSYKPDIVPIIEGVHLLYHESTFLEDKKNLTERTKHSTAKEAGKIAKLANVKQLILGHYSSRYSDITAFQKEAQTEFDNVELAESGKVFVV